MSELSQTLMWLRFVTFQITIHDPSGDKSDGPQKIMNMKDGAIPCHAHKAVTKKGVGHMFWKISPIRRKPDEHQ